MQPCNSFVSAKLSNLKWKTPSNRLLVLLLLAFPLFCTLCLDQNCLILFIFPDPGVSDRAQRARLSVCHLSETHRRRRRLCQDRLLPLLPLALLRTVRQERDRHLKRRRFEDGDFELSGVPRTATGSRKVRSISGFA